MVARGGVQHGLHFIADEIYLASDYSAELLGGPARYVSALTLKIRKPHLFHFVWAFSKVGRDGRMWAWDPSQAARLT